MSANRIYNLKKDEPDERDLEVNYTVTVSHEVLRRVYIQRIQSIQRIQRIQRMNTKQGIKCGDSYEV